MKNIIDSNSLDKHLVKKYNFKILGSSQNSYNDNTEDESGTSNNIPEKSQKDKEPEENEVSKEVKDGFIAELLEKSDKMSTELVKLQMQIEEGQKEFEKRIKIAKDEAYEEGKKAGYNDAKNEFETNQKELENQFLNSIKKLDELYGKCKNYMDSLKDELSDVSLEIAKEVIQKEISKDSKSIAFTLASKLLEELKDASKIELKVNPDDYEYIKEKFSEKENIEVAKDEAINRGGVVLLSELGNIDGDLKTRIEKTKELLAVEK